MREGLPETGVIEQELDDTRSRLDATIGALQQKLAPGTVVDQAVEYFREGGGVEFSRNFGRTVRDNPMPVALIGVGLGWLMFSGMRRGDDEGDGWRERRWSRDDQFRVGGRDRDLYGRGPGGFGEYADSSVHQPMPYEAAAYDDLASKAEIAGSEIRRDDNESEDSFRDRVHAARGKVLGISRQAGEASHGFRERVEEAMRAAAARVRSVADEAGSRAGRYAESGQSAARGFYRQGQSALSDARERAGQAVDQMRGMGDRTIDYVQEQPLLLGALGITVGAVIGMLVPASRYERRVASSLRGQIGEAAREMASDAGHGAMRVADTVLDTAREFEPPRGFRRRVRSGFGGGSPRPGE